MNDQFQLSPVLPANLAARWPTLRPHIEAMLDRSGEGELPEQLYADCLMSNSYLWALPDDTGFVVLELHPTRTGKVLFVVLGWNQSEPDARVYLEQIKQIAEDNDCSRIRWVSDRRWERHLPESKVRYLYEVNLEGSG